MGNNIFMVDLKDLGKINLCDADNEKAIIVSTVEKLCRIVDMQNLQLEKLRDELDSIRAACRPSYLSQLRLS